MKLENAQAGPILLALRHKRNLTQKEAAARAKLSRSRLAALEGGAATNIELNTLLKLLDVYEAEIRIEPKTPRPTLNQIMRERELA